MIRMEISSVLGQATIRSRLGEESYSDGLRTACRIEQQSGYVEKHVTGDNPSYGLVYLEGLHIT